MTNQSYIRKGVMPVRESKRFVDGHKGKQPSNNVKNNTKKKSEPPSCGAINVTWQQPMKEDNAIKCVKISVNFVSFVQKSTTLITFGSKKTCCLVDKKVQISVASLEFRKKTNIKVSTLKPADIYKIV